CRLSTVDSISDRVITRLRVVDDQGGDGGLRVHHEALGQVDADSLAWEEAEDRRLVGEIGARRVAGAVALAAVAGLEAIRHRQLRRIRQGPALSDLPVQPRGRALAGFD